MSKKEKPIPVNVHIRETFEAQLPIIAAILSIGEDEIDFKQLAQDAISLVIALEEELSEG